MKSYLPPEYIVERDEDKCIRCKVCVNQCTYETHSYDAEDDIICSKDENCVNCQRCVTFCPTHAITIRKNPNATATTPTGPLTSSKTSRNKQKQAESF